jgi:hypothetical protein
MQLGMELRFCTGDSYLDIHAGGGGSDASINTAADVGTTSAAKISAACPALRELDLFAPFPFPLPRSLAMSKEDTLSRFH